MGQAYVLSQQIVQSRDLPCVVFFPDQMYRGSAGDLRACAIAKELRHLNWRTIIVPPWLSLRERLRIIRTERPEFVHIQQSRHPLNRPRFYEQTPCIFDADDADIVNHRDCVEECCRGSSAVITGNNYLAELFSEFNADVNVIWTGTYIKSVSNALSSERRLPVIAWAQSNPFDYPDEADLVRNILLRLAKRCRFTFFLFGVRNEATAEAYLAPIRAAGVAVRAFPPLHYGTFIRTLAGATIGLQPVCVNNMYSRGKSFGKLLAYMAADLAVVASDVLDYPLFYSHGQNGMLVKSIDQWVDACQFLIEQPAERERLVNNARKAFLQRLSIATAATMFNKILTRVKSSSCGSQSLPNPRSM
jgi:hypothetical protein